MSIYNLNSAIWSWIHGSLIRGCSITTSKAIVKPQQWAKVQCIILCIHTWSSGPRAPHYPQQVSAQQITPNSATIQWTVPSIAYTPETYVVEYGTSEDNLNLTSDSQHSGPNISIGSRSYSVQLSGLRVATLYYFSVVATNTVGPNETNGSFHTNEIGIAQHWRKKQGGWGGCSPPHVYGKGHTPQILH